MKWIKGISLFLIYPCIMLGIGMYAGVVLEDFFYPGREELQAQTEEISYENPKPVRQEAVPTASEKEVLNADTEYVIEEYDTKRDTLVESIWTVPAKYLGMDRDTFLMTMELYELAPPLSEQKRGFVGLEVRSFSAQKVVVRMNYAYAEPTKGFYLKVEDNIIVVYCDDEETVYLYTDISAETLPEDIQGEIIAGMYVEDEAALYHFLETYSS